jgi:hypothetical protein
MPTINAGVDAKTTNMAQEVGLELTRSHIPPFSVPFKEKLHNLTYRDLN